MATIEEIDRQKREERSAKALETIAQELSKTRQIMDAIYKEIKSIASKVK